MRKTLITFIVLALVTASAFVTQAALDRVELSPAATAATESPSDAPLLLASSYQQCMNSYDQCVQSCQFYQPPTRQQCLSWCYQTHWCAQV